MIRHSPAAERNKAAILQALLALLPAQGRMLELAAGTGQHARHFASHLPGWQWLPSDPDPLALPPLMLPTTSTEPVAPVTLMMPAPAAPEIEPPMEMMPAVLAMILPDKVPVPAPCPRWSPARLPLEATIPPA